METPKPPASSELRRPSTRPYARRKRAATGHDGDAIVEPVNEAQGTPAKSKAKPRSRAKTQPATPAALAVAAAAPAANDAASVEPELSEISLDASDIESAIAALTDVTLSAHLVSAVETTDAASAAPLSLDAQIDASLDVIESLIGDLLDVTRPISAPMQQRLLAQQNSEAPLFTELPSPRHLPTGAPTDPALPPGLVPRGDSRSLRRGELFALVYRVHCFVVTRHGKVGQLGHWSAVEYPTPTSASHAYARGCSHWVSEGFSDYRG